MDHIIWSINSNNYNMNRKVDGRSLNRPIYSYVDEFLSPESRRYKSNRSSRLGIDIDNGIIDN